MFDTHNQAIEHLWQGFYDAIDLAAAHADALAVDSGIRATVDDGAASRRNLNPITMAQGLYQAARHPIDTATATVGAMGREWEKVGEADAAGRNIEAAGHALAGSIPFLGPAAAAAGERIGSGDVAGGLGEAAGLIAPMAAYRKTVLIARLQTISGRLNTGHRPAVPGLDPMAADCDDRF